MVFELTLEKPIGWLPGKQQTRTSEAAQWGGRDRMRLGGFGRALAWGAVSGLRALENGWGQGGGKYWGAFHAVVRKLDFVLEDTSLY